MSKFKVGDRVVVTYVDEFDHASVGSAGTILKALSPYCEDVYWVRFDDPTGYGDSGHDEVAQIGGWKDNYMDLLHEDQLELVGEQEFTDDPPQTVLDALFSARDALDEAVRLIQGDV